MPRADALSRIDVLILSSLARLPMHGYELKLELQYKHVRWWAKCEHGHLYASLKRLEHKRYVKGSTVRDGKRARRVLAITAAGRAWLSSALAELALAPDATYFDVDLFLSAAFTLERDEALRLLHERSAVLRGQREEACALQARMRGLVPAAGELIMEHRIRHFTEEAEFAERAACLLAEQPSWQPFLGPQSIGEFIRRESVPLEPEAKARASKKAHPARARTRLAAERRSSAARAGSGARKRRTAR
jgi:DNA-binding PadR family transcriptional regulator